MRVFKYKTIGQDLGDAEAHAVSGQPLSTFDELSSYLLSNAILDEPFHWYSYDYSCWVPFAPGPLPPTTPSAFPFVRGAKYSALMRQFCDALPTAPRSTPRIAAPADEPAPAPPQVEEEPAAPPAEEPAVAAPDQPQVEEVVVAAVAEAPEAAPAPDAPAAATSPTPAPAPASDEVVVVDADAAAAAAAGGALYPSLVALLHAVEPASDAYPNLRRLQNLLDAAPDAAAPAADAAAPEGSAAAAASA